MIETHDYSAFVEDTIPQAGDNLLAALTGLADQQEQAEAEISRLEELLNEAKTNLQRISEQEIPKLVDGMEGKLTLPDGRTIDVSEKLRCYTLTENRARAMKWLEDNGHGAIVKRRFIVEFGRDQEEWAKEFERQLAHSEKPLNLKRERNVQWQTLDAWGRERLEEGEDIPSDLFQIHRIRQTKIK